MLWLSIHLPRLALEVFGCDSSREPLAAVEGQRIVLAGPAAEHSGVRPGMRIAAAQALCPHLIVRERAPRMEQRALGRLAAWCIQFTPSLAMEPPTSLLLEIGGSMHYFGGLAPLQARVREGLKALGYTYRLGIAPTPTAAWALSLAGDEQPVMQGRSLDRRLGRLPAALLVTDESQHKSLQGLGISSIADCLALPRDGLARRLGKELVDCLDRALGRRADPRKPYLPPAGFRSRIETPGEIIHTGQLGFALNRLVHELCGFLRGTGNGIQRLQIALDHPRHPPTGFELGTLEPNRDPAHLMSLLRERLQRVDLPAPVVSVTLEALQLQHLDQQPMYLLEPESDGTLEGWTSLLERLSARLGEPRIRGLGTQPGHRPERAWQYTVPGERTAVGNHPERPLWLFPEPERLPVRDSQPVWHGPLALEQGPECIETGWWDGGDIRRDYYIAANPQGTRLWVFRERRPPRGWYLHGIFS